MSKTFNVAVAGATGAVGETMISILEERDFPVGNLYPLASSRSAGSKIRFKGKDVVVQDLAEFDRTLFGWRQCIRNICTEGCGRWLCCHR